MRIKNLDFLRGLAIIGVVFQHSIWSNSITQKGWIGVDLFFVLSGFLISMLLFREIKEKKSVNTKLFLIRRGFKIYPSFYFFLFSTLLYMFFMNGDKYDWRHILSEVFFLQSYLWPIWQHTWSLAIEEHFYIFIAITIWIFMRTGVIFKKYISLFTLIFFWLVLVKLRFRYCYFNIDEESIRFFNSHLRGDGLMLGCILAYCFTFFDKTKYFFSKYKTSLLILTIPLLSPLYLWKTGSFNMDTYGITSLGFAFAIFIAIASLNLKLTLLKLLKQTFNFICYIGLYSYSIYLWHLFVVYECNHWTKDVFYHTIFYVPFSLIAGILFSKIIEWPTLRLRDKYFPSTKTATTTD